MRSCRILGAFLVLFLISGFIFESSAVPISLVFLESRSTVLTDNGASYFPGDVTSASYSATASANAVEYTDVGLLSGAQSERTEAQVTWDLYFQITGDPGDYALVTIRTGFSGTLESSAKSDLTFIPIPVIGLIPVWGSALGTASVDSFLTIDGISLLDETINQNSRAVIPTVPVSQTTAISFQERTERLIFSVGDIFLVRGNLEVAGSTTDVWFGNAGAESGFQVPFSVNAILYRTAPESGSSIVLFLISFGVLGIWKGLQAR